MEEEASIGITPNVQKQKSTSNNRNFYIHYLQWNGDESQCTFALGNESPKKGLSLVAAETKRILPKGLGRCSC